MAMIQARTDEKTGRPYASVGGRKIPIPRSRLARLALGGALAIGGLLGFLPILGFWMVPVGLVVLSYDLPVARRLLRVGRKVVVRGWRKWRDLRGNRRRTDRKTPFTCV